MTMWLGEHRLEGRLVARIGRDGELWVADFPNVGILTATADGDKTRFDPATGAASTLVAKAKCGTVAALVRHLQGKITLHGSAIAAPSGAIAFIGPSGAGKSTLAAAFAQERDVTPIADDIVCVELPSESRSVDLVKLMPTQTAAWLDRRARAALGLDTSQAGKTAISFEKKSSAAIALNSVVLLTFSSDESPPVLSSLHGQECFAALSNSTLRFAIDEPAAQVREFGQFSVIATKCSVFELRRPRDLAKLPMSISLVRKRLFEVASREGAQ
jgi:hypothetical protein